MSLIVGKDNIAGRHFGVSLRGIGASAWYASTPVVSTYTVGRSRRHLLGHTLTLDVYIASAAPPLSDSYYTRLFSPSERRERVTAILACAAEIEGCVRDT